MGPAVPVRLRKSALNLFEMLGERPCWGDTWQIPTSTLHLPLGTWDSKQKSVAVPQIREQHLLSQTWLESQGATLCISWQFLSPLHQASRRTQKGVGPKPLHFISRREMGQINWRKQILKHATPEHLQRLILNLTACLICLPTPDRKTHPVSHIWNRLTPYTQAFKWGKG